MEPTLLISPLILLFHQPQLASPSSQTGTTYTQSPQGEVSIAEFTNQILAQIVSSESRRLDNVGPVSGFLYGAQVGQFMGLNLPTFLGSKVEKNPEHFINKIDKIFQTMHVSDIERV